MDSETLRKIREMLGISVFIGCQVEALEAVCLKKCETGVCGNWEQKVRVFRSNPYRDQPRHWQRATSLVQHL